MLCVASRSLISGFIAKYSVVWLLETLLLQIVFEAWTIHGKLNFYNPRSLEEPGKSSVPQLWKKQIYGMFTFKILLRLWTCRVAATKGKCLKSLLKKLRDIIRHNVQQKMCDKIYCFTTVQLMLFTNVFVCYIEKSQEKSKMWGSAHFFTFHKTIIWNIYDTVVNYHWFELQSLWHVSCWLILSWSHPKAEYF